MNTSEHSKNGLVIIPNFITEDEERDILIHIDKKPKFKTDQRNSIQRYGSDEIYKGNCFISATIPEYLQQLSKRIRAYGGHWETDKSGNVKPHKQITVNQYYEGQKIDWHIDSSDSGELITVLSLCSDCDMNFKREMSSEEFKIILPQRSLMFLQGELRHKFYHAILNHKEYRTSIVLRNGING